MDRGVWRATVQGLSRTWRQLKWHSKHSWLLLIHSFRVSLMLPGDASDKEPTCQCRRSKRCGFDPYIRKIPWRRAWQPTLGILPVKSHGQSSLASFSPWGRKGLDTTEATACTGSNWSLTHSTSVGHLQWHKLPVGRRKTKIPLKEGMHMGEIEPECKHICCLLLPTLLQREIPILIVSVHGKSLKYIAGRHFPPSF